MDCCGGEITVPTGTVICSDTLNTSIFYGVAYYLKGVDCKLDGFIFSYHNLKLAKELLITEKLPTDFISERMDTVFLEMWNRCCSLAPSGYWFGFNDRGHLGYWSIDD